MTAFKMAGSVLRYGAQLDAAAAAEVVASSAVGERTGTGEEKKPGKISGLFALKQGKLRASKTRPQWAFIGIS